MDSTNQPQPEKEPCMSSPAERTVAAMSRFPACPRGRLRFLVTAGPTYEDIDAVRFLGNRSQGHMGIAVAQAALEAGHQVLLILGPTEARPPAGCPVVRVRSAEDMYQAVLAAMAWVDVLVMAAAVADYRPAERVPGKLHKQDADLALRLERTRDILHAVAGRGRERVTVGFSLEPELDLDRAEAKRAAKRVDILVANSVRAMGTHRTDAVVLERDREPSSGFPDKQALARHLVDRAISWAAERLPGRNLQDAQEEAP